MRVKGLNSDGESTWNCTRSSNNDESIYYGMSVTMFKTVEQFFSLFPLATNNDSCHPGLIVHHTSQHSSHTVIQRWIRSSTVDSTNHFVTRSTIYSLVNVNGTHLIDHRQVSKQRKFLEFHAGRRRRGENIISPAGNTFSLRHVVNCIYSGLTWVVFLLIDCIIHCDHVDPLVHSSSVACTCLLLSLKWINFCLFFRASFHPNK